MSERSDHAGELRSELVDVAVVLAALGVQARREGASWKALCLWHEERTPSMSVRLGPDGTLQARCHGCGEGGDVLSLIAATHGLATKGADFGRVLAEGARIAGRWDILDAIEGRSSGERRAAPPPRLPLPPAPERPYPPAEEVRALWEASRRVTEDPEVSAWLRSRALDPETVDALDLARALPPGALPSWARWRGASWAETGHRCALPLFDAAGELRSVRARLVRSVEGPKCLPASGYRSTGIALADRTARGMLATRELPGKRLVIAEGEPDFLTWATRVSDADEAPFGVIGIYASAWSPELAARVPDGARVAVWTHHDANGTGEKYAREIAKTLAPRCELRRGR